MNTEPSNPRLPPNARSGASKPGLMRNLGQFFGHVVQGVKSRPEARPGTGTSTSTPPPVSTASHITRHEVIERVQDTPSGPVKIRRTIIEDEQVETPPRIDAMER